MNRVYDNRFLFLLVTQVLVLFGSLFFPLALFEGKVAPFLYLMTILAGVNLVSKRRVLFWMVILLFIASFMFFGSSLVIRTSTGNEAIRFGLNFIFHALVAGELVRQVWKSKFIDRHVILGLMCGYISLGFLGFFFFAGIELLQPGSFFNSLAVAGSGALRMDSLMYYSFTTLLSIGYGEIVPATPIAQKASILIGLMGQFYLAILTAIIIGKYLRGEPDGAGLTDELPS
jgi:voltage-gated potassium channel Kch